MLFLILDLNICILILNIFLLNESFLQLHSLPLRQILKNISQLYLSHISFYFRDSSRYRVFTVKVDFWRDKSRRSMTKFFRHLVSSRKDHWFDKYFCISLKGIHRLLKYSIISNYRFCDSLSFLIRSIHIFFFTAEHFQAPDFIEKFSSINGNIEFSG